MLGLVASMILVFGDMNAQSVDGTRVKLSDHPRATWVWGTEMLLMLDSPVFRDTVLLFLKERKLTTVYLYAAQLFGTGSYPLVDRPDEYATLVSKFHVHGIEVYALLDAVDVSVDSPIIDHFRNVLDYNNSRIEDEKFDGASLDIEPWQNPDWESNRPELSQDYLDLAGELMAIKEAQNPELIVGPTMPFWFDTFAVDRNGISRPMNEHTQNIYDYVTILAFRDKARGIDSIIFHTRNELEYAVIIDQPIVIGVETNPGELDKVTFFEEPAFHTPRAMIFIF